jgi:hypothetical protein
MIREITTQLGIGKKNLRYWNICCYSFPCLLMDKHKRVHINVASQLLERLDAKSSYFLLNTVTSDKIWYLNFNPNCR